MVGLPTRKQLGDKAHIKKELKDIINQSLDYLERDGGEAVNYVLEKGIVALGLPHKKQHPSLYVEKRTEVRKHNTN